MLMKAYKWYRACSTMKYSLIKMWVCKTIFSVTLLCWYSLFWLICYIICQQIRYWSVAGVCCILAARSFSGTGAWQVRSRLLRGVVGHPLGIPSKAGTEAVLRLPGLVNEFVLEDMVWGDQLLSDLSTCSEQGSVALTWSTIICVKPMNLEISC